MNRITLTAVALILVISSASHADFKVQRKIPAPKACVSAQANRVTGLAPQTPGAGPEALFVTTQCLGVGLHNYVHLIRPADGEVLGVQEFSFVPPYCGAPVPHLTSGDQISGNDYVVGDVCGEIMWITFNPDTVYLWDSADPPHIGEPSGLIYRGDTLFTLDRDSLDLLVVQVDGYNVLGRYPLPSTDPGALAIHDGHLFVLSRNDSSRIYEMTTAGAVVDTHSVEGLYGCFPSGAAFVGSELYVGGVLDSILVLTQYDYSVPVEPGDSVTVEVVPDRVEITFEGVLDSGYVNADVMEEDPCPRPSGVEFLTDFYHVTTTASLQCVSQIAITDSVADEVDPDLIRVFVRPAGFCQPWRDITVDSTVVIPVLARLTQTLSEDDEFSVFALAADHRNQNGVVEFKFSDLSGHLNSAQDSIPPAAYGEIRNLIIEAQELFAIGHYSTAALRADSIATVVRSYQTIPDVYDPENPGRNVAGRLIARAHTLAFSIRFFPQWLAGTGGGPPLSPNLLSVRPNPSGAAIQVRYVPSGMDEMRLDVYSPAGRRIRRLFQGRSGGRAVSVGWDGRNEDGREVAPGVYFVVAGEGSETWTKKVILQR